MVSKLYYKRSLEYHIKVIFNSKLNTYDIFLLNKKEQILLKQRFYYDGIFNEFN